MTAPTPDEAAAHLRAKVDRLPDSDAITVEKTYVRALLAERETLHANAAAETDSYLRLGEARDKVRAERDSLRARLAAQQPVIDAAEGVHAVGGDDLLLVMPAAGGRLRDALAAYRAASGSVEADTPAEPEQHRLDVWERDDNDWTWRCTCQVHGASWPSERAAQEAADEHAREVAGTPAAEPAPDDVREALSYLKGRVATSSRDWSLNRGDAELYALLVGWDCEAQHEHDDICGGTAAMDEVAAKHAWPPEFVAILRRRRRALAGAGAPTEPADDGVRGYIIARFRDATDQHGDLTLDYWDDDVHRTEVGAFDHYLQHVDDEHGEWEMYELRRLPNPRAALAGSADDTREGTT